MRFKLSFATAMRSAHRLTLVTILALCPLAYADTIFNFSATINSIPGPSRGYPPTSPATGTITIDTVQGVVTGASIQTFATSFDFVNFTLLERKLGRNLAYKSEASLHHTPVQPFRTGYPLAGQLARGIYGGTWLLSDL